MVEQLVLPAVPQHLVATPQGLAELCDHLRAAGRFAFDTEFIGEFSYRPVLCLVQVATPERVALIDPLALPDLTPLWDVLADPDVEKYCHAGDQDVAIAWEAGQKPPRNVLDTQIAAGMIGLGYPLAYWRLVEHYCGETLDKAHTYSAWHRRPLSPAQFRYAVDDVRYLCHIADGLRTRLVELDRMAWATAASEELCAGSCEPTNPQTLYARMRGAGSLNGPQLSALRALVAWREQLAFEHDAPPRTLVKDEPLLELATRSPKTAADLQRVPGLPTPEIATYSDMLISMIREAKALPADRWPPSLSTPWTDTINGRATVDMLWGAAQVICLGQSVAPGLVVSQALIANFARLLMEDLPLEEHPLMRSWRGECLGRPLVELYRGNEQINMDMPDKRMQVRFAARKSGNDGNGAPHSSADTR